MSEVVKREMTLREKAQRWLDCYKKNDTITGDMFINLMDWATIVAEYLHATAPFEKEEGTIAEEAKATSERIKALQDELSKTHLMLESAKMTHESLACDLARARAKNEAYEFVIRCNGVSGAEVH